MKPATLFFLTIVVCCSCSRQRVNVQMFVKAPLCEEGVVVCNAEGKTYGIRPVTEQTFYPGEDSFHKMHHHGVALESEVMAYRIYFDKRQTVDVYAKRTPQLELAESLWYPDDEQLARGFGDDVLKVGNTIGVGSVRPWSAEMQKLVNMDRFVSRTQRIVSCTADCAVAEVEVKGLQIEEKTVNLLTRYTIRAGHRDMQCEVFASDTLSSLVTGVQKIGNGEISTINCQLSTVLASWGTDWPVNDTVKYAKETLGIMVAVPERYAGEVIYDVRQTLVSLILEHIDSDSFNYYCTFTLAAVSMKEKNPPAHSADEFFSYIANLY